MANENGWGDGVLNNDIGWGQGSNNEIGWGSIYAVSESGLTALESNATPLLLDLYPDASAAYSVRKLRSDYAGAALQVRRSSDDSEQDIGFVGTDLDTESLLTFVGAGDGFVVTWYDQSGNGFNANQSVATQQRQIVSSGVLETENSKPTTISTATSTQYNTSSSVYAVSVPFIASVSVSNPSGNVFGAYFGTNPSSQGFRIYKTNATGIRLDTVRTITSIASYTAGTGQEVLIATANRVNLTARKNGVSLGSAGTDTNTNFLGSIASIWGEGTSGRCLKGNAQELILFSADITSDISGIESNINTYYSIY